MSTLSGFRARWRIAVAICLVVLGAAGAIMGPFRQSIEYMPIPSGALPPLPGPHRPSVVSLTLDGPSGPLAVDVWYPSRAGQLGDLAASDGDSRNPRAGGAPAGAPTEPRFKKAVPLGLTQSGRPIEAKPRLPLIVYAPGWNGLRSSNTILLSCLASVGYVVAAIDDVGADLSVPLEVRDFDFKSETGFARSWSAGRQRIDLMSQRITAVLDGLLMPSSAPAGIAGLIDPEAIGVMGFSFGGSVAAEAPASDPRIKAAVNLDGWLFGASTQRGVGVPYLSFGSEFPDLAAAAQARSTGKRLMAKATIEDYRIQRKLAADPHVYALIVAGTQHPDFSDDVFSPPLRSYLRAPWGLGKAGQLEVFDLTTTLTVAFLDAYLKKAPLAASLKQRTASGRLVWMVPE